MTRRRDDEGLLFPDDPPPFNPDHEERQDAPAGAVVLEAPVQEEDNGGS